MEDKRKENQECDYKGLTKSKGILQQMKEATVEDYNTLDENSLSELVEMLGELQHSYKSERSYKSKMWVGKEFLVDLRKREGDDFLYGLIENFELIVTEEAAEYIHEFVEEYENI